MTMVFLACSSGWAVSSGGSCSKTSMPAPGQLAAVQGVGHRCESTTGPRCGVDEVGTVLHPGDGVLVNQVSGLIVERAVQRDDVALLEQLVSGTNSMQSGSWPVRWRL